MFDFHKLFSEIAYTINGTQKKLDVKSAVGVYYGINGDGNYRLAFMSPCEAYTLPSTKLLNVTYGRESDNVYWICFDLMQPAAKNVFYTFCGDMVSAISGIAYISEGLKTIKNRFNTWINLFKKDSGQTSVEVLKGLFGELYFLKNYMIPKYGIKEAVLSWSGPDDTSKDFSVDLDWYEVKTVAAGAVTVKISSIQQLSSNVPGKLEIVKVENMSSEYNDGECCILQLFENILGKISDEEVREYFISRVTSFGLAVTDEAVQNRYKVVSVTGYRVADGFPRVTEKEVPYGEIGKLTYELIINMLNSFKEEE